MEFRTFELSHIPVTLDTNKLDILGILKLWVTENIVICFV